MFSKLTLKSKIIAAFSLMSLIIFLLAGKMVVSLQTIKHDNIVYVEASKFTENINEIYSNYVEMLKNSEEFFIVNDEKYFNLAKVSHDKLKESLESKLALIKDKNPVLYKDLKVIYDETEGFWERFSTIATTINELNVQFNDKIVTRINTLIADAEKFQKTQYNVGNLTEYAKFGEFIKSGLKAKEYIDLYSRLHNKEDAKKAIKHATNLEAQGKGLVTFIKPESFNNLASEIKSFSGRFDVNNNAYKDLVKNSNKKIYEEIKHAKTDSLAIEKAANTDLKDQISSSLSFGVGTVVLATLFTFILSFAFIKMISKPILNMAGNMREISKGKLEVTVENADRADEIGQMARALEVFRQNAIKNAEYEKSKVKDQEIERKRQNEINQLVGMFGKSIGSVLTAVNSASDDMISSARNLQQTANNNSDESNDVLTLSEDTSQGTEKTSHATDELYSSIAEIAKQTNQTTDIASNAMVQVRESYEKITKLKEASMSIGEVIEFINEISEKTNLLALNATIEAARAGDSGKGFAVVATEVKSLAHQTSQATEKIANQIQIIQQYTDTSVTAMEKTQETIEEINSTISIISSAVTEQEAATKSISDNIRDAYENTQSVSTKIENIREGAQVTVKEADTVEASSVTLSEQSQTLSDEVQSFLGSINDSSKRDKMSIYDVQIPVELRVDGNVIRANIVKLSIAGIQLDCNVPETNHYIAIDFIDHEFKTKGRYCENNGLGGYLQFPLNEQHINMMIEKIKDFITIAA